MGKFQQLRAKAIPLRGAIAMGGAVVVAASMFQAADTLAAPDEVRQAKAGIATQNYFPTPLVTNVSCDTHGSPIGSRRARVSWDPVEGVTGYRLEILVWNSNNANTAIRQSYDLNATTTSVSNIRDSNREVLYARVRTMNGQAISSGYATPPERISFKDYITGRTECENTGHPTLPNHAWENQRDWDPGVIPFAVGPSPSIFAALFDDDASRDLLGELPEGDELSSLDDATLEAVLATPEEATTESITSAPSSTPPGATSSSSTPSSPTSTEPAAASTSVPGTSPSETSTEPSASVLADSSSPPPSTAAAAVTRSSTQSTPSSSPTPTATSTRARESIRAQVGDDPIAVGLSQARLEEVDGHTQLIITRNGGRVCTAEVDGASRIESSDGALTVTVSGRPKSVDPETCKVD